MACFWYLFSIFKPNKFRCQVQLQWPHKICWRLHAFQIWHLKLNFNTENRFQFNRINLTLKQSMSQICRSLVLSRQRFQYTISSTHTKFDLAYFIYSRKHCSRWRKSGNRNNVTYVYFHNCIRHSIILRSYLNQ